MMSSAFTAMRPTTMTASSGNEATYDKAYEIAKAMTSKHERMDRFDALEAEFEARFSEEELAEKKMLIKRYFHDDVLKKAMRNMILEEGIRLDGRRTDEIRPIWCEIDYLRELTVRRFSPGAKRSR